MQQLAVRIWSKGEMIYPTKFSVMFNTKSRKSSVRVFVNNDKIISMDYMLITPFDAMNGPIFDKDIILIDEDEQLRIVSYDDEKGEYIAYVPGNKDDYIVMSKSHLYEVAGNTYEDKELLNPNNDKPSDTSNITDTETVKTSKKKKKKKKAISEVNADITNTNQQQELVPQPQEPKKEIIDDNVLVESEKPKESIFINSGKTALVDIKLSAKCDGDTGVFSYMVFRDSKKEITSGLSKKTNKKRILIQGIIDALNNFDGNFNINIKFVEPYVVHPFIKGWIEKWKSSNWTKESGEKIQNSELWEELYLLSQRYKIKWEMVQVSDSDFDELSSTNDSIIKSL